MWLAHYDRIGREYVARCVEVLDRDEGVVVVHTSAEYIDEHGRQILCKGLLTVDAAMERACDRFEHLIRLEHNCNAIFGLMRTAVLKQTGLHGAYADSDRVLLAEMGLRGRFHLIPERLLSRRLHALQVTARYSGRQERTLAFDPSREQAGPSIRTYVSSSNSSRRYSAARSAGVSSSYVIGT